MNSDTPYHVDIMSGFVPSYYIGSSALFESSITAQDIIKKWCYHLTQSAASMPMTTASTSASF